MRCVAQQSKRNAAQSHEICNPGSPFGGAVSRRLTERALPALRAFSPRREARRETRAFSASWCVPPLISLGVPPSQLPPGEALELYKLILPMTTPCFAPVAAGALLQMPKSASFASRAKATASLASLS